MTLHPGSSELLAALSQAVAGVAVRVAPVDGPPAVYGEAPPLPAAELRAELPGGEVVATCAAGEPGVRELVAAMLRMVAAFERLECDMESMNASSLRLMERVYELGEALPQLSAGVDEFEIANLGVRACHRAASVQQVVYVAHDPSRPWCEVIVHFTGAEGSAAATQGLPQFLPAQEGFLGDVLARREGFELRAVPEGERLGEPGSPEHLAQHQILGVPVTFGAGGKRMVLGALLLIDKRVSAYANDDLLGTEEMQVAHSFAAMLGAVLGARKSAELGKEMTMARAIQRQILPLAAIELSGFDVAAEYRVCGAVGGDYFDYVPLADGRQMVVIADVSGHNLASGMMMVSARAMLRMLASVRSEPAQVFDRLAASMHEDLTRTERFLTAAAVALRADDRVVEYVSAGHNDLLVYRAASDRVEAVASRSTILGFVPDPVYESCRIRLEPGDCLLLFTDGITEAMDETEAMFGDDRLAAVLAQLAPGRTARGIVDGVLHELDRFRRGRLGHDDVTVVAIRCVAREGRR
ncbi:MAG: PP2C family protein-serine/threonine phosphatase [Planctomycetes bacterium]|nr:PP2C family protein-serine/threonine phosphatase [Planctomycetota bacterium]